MQLITLGTGSPLPDANRAGPATLVRAGGRDLLFDCGRGVLMRAAAVLSGPLHFDTVFLTHLHSDHVTDFNDIVTTRWVISPTPNPLRVVGPVGTQGFVDRTIAMLSDDIRYRIAHHDTLSWDPPCDVREVDDGPVLEESELRVITAPTEHAPARPSLGYRIEADGKVVVIAGDTVPCEGLDRLCAGADVYVQTVIRRSMVEAIPAPRLQDILDYHSSLQDAAATASRAGVGTLVLTHPVPPPAPGSEPDWVAEAAEGFDGRIVLAHDLWEHEL
jgi:ribonuclease Z